MLSIATVIRGRNYAQFGRLVANGTYSGAVLRRTPFTKKPCAPSSKPLPSALLVLGYRFRSNHRVLRHLKIEHPHACEVGAV